jgi:hypothetical protein
VAGRSTQSLGVNVNLRTSSRVVVTASILLGGCGVDTFGVEKRERTSVSSAVSPGAPFAPVQPALAQRGYDCRTLSGNFEKESGGTGSAPSFLWCAKQSQSSLICSIRTQVIVVPNGSVVGQLHVHADDVCP